MGLLAGRMRIITEAAAHTGLLKKILVVGGAVGLVGNFSGAQAMIGGTADRDLGMQSHVGRLGTIGMALVVFAAQVLFSVIWLKHTSALMSLLLLCSAAAIATSGIFHQFFWLTGGKVIESNRRIDVR